MPKDKCASCVSPDLDGFALILALVTLVRILLSRNMTKNLQNDLKILDFQLDVWDFHTGAYKICQNWLKAHNDQPLDHEYAECYLRLVLLLEEVVTLGEEIKVVFYNNQLKKLGIFQTICTIVTNQLGIAADKVLPAVNLTADLGVDSLDMLELFVALEAVFDIEITAQAAEKLTTVQQIINYINQEIHIGIYESESTVNIAAN